MSGSRTTLQKDHLKPSLGAPKGKTRAGGWEMLGSQVSARYAEGISNGGAPGQNRLSYGLGGESPVPVINGTGLHWGQ